MSTQRRGAIPRSRPAVGDTVAHRHDSRVLREAMNHRGWGLQALADKTADVDPEHAGLSVALLSFLASSAPWGRDTTSLESAHLIARAFGVPFSALFYEYVVPSRRGLKKAP